jgi:5-methylcytosine-specific restriction enzyme subunit McrC
MRPDLVFREPGGDERYVGDVKYKLATDARGRSGDYYQLLAYTTAMDLPEGVLIYCRRQDDLDQSTVTVRNARKKLVLRSVDLTGPSAKVEHEIAELADAIAKAQVPVA